MERTVETPDGRILAVQETGDPAGRPVLVHMGTPNSRHLYGPNAVDAGARGLRLICYDRPGYGGSTPQPGRTHADCAADVRAICASLQIDQVAIWGISGGGAHALACAALLPDLVVAAASLAGLAPYPAEGLDCFEGMGLDNVDDFQLFMNDNTAARVKMEKDREQFLAASAEDLGKALESLPEVHSWLSGWLAG
jgi:pimeloyl-ACP methyl ester carboxylesterase